MTLSAVTFRRMADATSRMEFLLSTATTANSILEKVQTFDSFTEDNDPHGEHDFGSFEHNGDRIFWKIDYYDRASFATDEPFGSEDPEDPAVTLRVLTVLFPSEY